MRESLFSEWAQDPNTVLEHPDGRKVYPNGRIVLADGTETTIEEIRKQRNASIE